MKVWLWVALLMGLLLSSALAAKRRSRDKKTHKTFQEMEQMDEDDDDRKDRDDDDEREDDDADDDDSDDEEEEEEDIESRKRHGETVTKNPCMEKTCRRGEICIVDRKYRAKCVCYIRCLPGHPGDDRYQVCSKRNVTYESECALDRDHCLCRRQQDGCSNPKFKKIRLDYFGSCQQLTRCTEREFKEFPSRTRAWLYVIMKDLADRAEIPQYQDLVERAGREVNYSHAVLWKFCDLDVAPHDRFVSRRELLYTIQSLKALEHCLIPFLDSCDVDSDGQITLVEWGTCLGLESDKIKNVCRTVHGRDKN